MNPNKISSDDPRLTAYALGEMEAAERSEFEQVIAGDAEARRAVEEIRRAGRALEDALATEAVPELVVPAAGAKLSREFNRKVTTFPHWLVGLAAAACFAMVFTYTQVEQANRPLVVAPSQPGASEGAGKNETRLVEVQLLPEKAVAQMQDRTSLVDATAAPVAPASGQSHDFSTMAAGSAPGAAGNSGPVMHEQLTVIGNHTATPALRAAPGGVGRADPGLIRAEIGARKRHPVGEPAAILLPDADRNFNTEAYAYAKDNDFLRVKGNELSTFSIDVDTAAYANVRRFLAAHSRPPRDAVRIEELVNYFPYHYSPPAGAAPFAASLEVAGAPWKPEHRLVRIGLKGREVSDAARPAANLVFLIDVSGSMNQPNKLPLVKQSLRMLVEKLRADDRVALAVYAGASGLALPSTPAARKAEILAAIDRLEAGGSTNGAAGLHLAYDVAKANFITGGVNRVILATDGDFNVGVTGEGELTRLIEEKAGSGVFLSVLGFGMGNYKDATLERLAGKGNGNYAYIDTEKEARKALVEQAGGTLVTIAKDVKIQVEFNPAVVQAYRLIGYENRLLAKEDFNNDRVDAGEIGAGHTVTALYEVVPVGVPMPETGGEVDPLKYQRTENREQRTEDRARRTAGGAEMLTVKVRYKEPAGDVSSKLEFPLVDGGRAFAEASADFKFAAAVASFGMILRESPHRGLTDFARVAAWAREGTGADAGGYRSEFLGLVAQARAVWGE